jgi:hypothetical protein
LRGAGPESRRVTAGARITRLRPASQPTSQPAKKVTFKWRGQNEFFIPDLAVSLKMIHFDISYV